MKKLIVLASLVASINAFSATGIEDVLTTTGVFSAASSTTTTAYSAIVLYKINDHSDNPVERAELRAEWFQIFKDNKNPIAIQKECADFMGRLKTGTPKES